MVLDLDGGKVTSGMWDDAEYFRSVVDDYSHKKKGVHDPEH